MKVAYITAHSPFGRGETFILTEMLAMIEHGVELMIVPRNPPKQVFHKEAQRIIGSTIWMPLLSIRFVLSALEELLSNSRPWKILYRIFRYSRSLKIAVKNIAVFPKAVFLVKSMRKIGIDHIHAHWGSTTASMGWIASELSSIPWSMTLHRWDIAENNLLRLKVDHAAFVRCISNDGRREALSIVGERYKEKLRVLHVGVSIPDMISVEKRLFGPPFTIVCPANYVQIKGHRYLLKACALLVNKGIKNFQCLLIGDGPLKQEIEKQIAELGLDNIVHLTGLLSHELLIEKYREGQVAAVVLPSIVTEDGEREGIPVALMEAMSYCIPVISTDTGGIPELLKGSCGLLVLPGHPEDLANAIALIMTDKEVGKELGRKARTRIIEEFNLSKNIYTLLKLMAKYSNQRNN